MNKKKVAAILAAALIVNISSTSIKAFADEVYGMQVVTVAEEASDADEKQAVVTKFDLINNESIEAYNNAFKMDNSNILSSNPNGGNYPYSEMYKAFDGDFSTHWETGKKNEGSFVNEVVITLKEPETLNRIVYAARQSTARGKGFAKQLEIYGTSTDDENDFELVCSGSYSGSISDTVEIKFQPTEFKKIKFKFVSCEQNWASASEFMFYREDAVSDKMDRLFTDGLMNEISVEFDSIEAISELEEEVNNHPLKNMYTDIIELAKEAAEGNTGSRVFELESRGNSIKEAQKRKLWNFQDWQPTGLAVKSGQVIEVFVEAEDGKPLPSLIFKQMDSQHNGNVTINLKKGRNVITIPEVASNQLRPGTAKAGVLYTSNPYTPEEQGSMPKIRIEGAFSYPCYIKGVTSNEEVMNALSEYVERLNKDSTLPDVFEVFSDKTLVNVNASFALDWYTKNNKLPSETADKSDAFIRETMRYWGFDGSSEINSDFNFRYVTMLKWLDNGGFMNAGNGITGFNKGSQGGALNVETGWGFVHEMGHNFDFNAGSIVEVTNNMLSMHFQRIKGETSKMTAQNQWESNIFKKVYKEDYSDNEYYPANDYSSLRHLAPLWQLQLIDEEFWPKYEQEFRSRNISASNWDDKHDAWVEIASDIFQLDLSEHFERHGMKVSDKTKAYTAKYDKPSKKFWYANDRIYLNDNGGVFTDSAEVSASAKLNDNKATITLGINEEDKNNVIGYEIIRDGEIIGFTSTNSFVDENPVEGQNHVYSVVAYDCELNAGKPYSFNLHEPSIELKEDIMIGLNAEFNPRDYAKAYTYDGNDITSRIEVIKNDIDLTKKGTYDIVYEVTDEGDTKTATAKVQVVSSFSYLSDLNWESATVSWRSVNKDAAINSTNKIKLKVDGEIKEFDKGFGTAENSEIVYNLDGNYETFTTYLGTDRNYYHSNTSVRFKIFADDKEVYTSNIIYRDSNAEFVKLDVTGVKTLKLVTDNVNGSGLGDFASWADTKIYTNNAKPGLSIPESVSVKVGETVDLAGGYSAYDAEDGDLTGSVKVSGDVNFNKPGTYEITYSVTDSDGNAVTAVRKVSVVNMDDYNYLTDYNWSSGKAGWGTIGKDKSIDGNTLRLTGEDGQAISYTRGIGTHSTSTIIYDLSDKDCSYFTSYVGVDREMYNSAASVSFEVYVDGVLKYNSGVMYSKDKQKYVEVDVTGAKELKLVVNNGNDTIGSDHGDWADAKLHFANEKSRDYTELSLLLEEVNGIDRSVYTEESLNELDMLLENAQSMIENKTGSYEDIQSAMAEIREKADNLERLDFGMVIEIEDKYLAQDIREALGISGDITLKDMYSLKSLTLKSRKVTSLKGLENAKNLEELNMEQNEVRDLSPLKELKKLSTINARLQIIEVGMAEVNDKVITIHEKITDRNGNVLMPKEIYAAGVKQDVESCIDEDGNIVIDASNAALNVFGIYITYENQNDNYEAGIIYMAAIQ